MRSASTVKNSIWGVIQQAIICVISLYSRRIMIDAIGIEGVGLNGLLTNVLSLLSLAEMGVGSAIVFHMYAPLAQNDEKRICALMRFYRSIYRIIAAVITVLGLCLLPFLGSIVKGVSYSYQYIAIIYLLFLTQTATTYLLSYKRSLLSADQKQYIISIYDLISRIVVMLGGMAVLYFTKELAYYMIFMIIAGLANNILISLKVDRMYPYIKEKDEVLPQTERRIIFKDVKNIFIGKISGTITNSTDNLLISALVGTIVTGLYSNYTIILNTLTSVMAQLSSAMSGSIGNLLATEEPAYVEKTLKRLLFLMFFIATFCCSCLLCLIDPFISLAFGKDLLLSRITVYICIINFYLSSVKIPLWSMVTASGLFKYDKYISISGSTVNLIVSIIFGKICGIDGILIGTMLTILIQYVLKVILFYSKFLKINCRGFFIRTVAYFVIAATECVIISFIAGKVNLGNDYITFIAKGLVAAICPLAINLLLFFRSSEFAYFRSKLKF